MCACLISFDLYNVHIFTSQPCCVCIKAKLVFFSVKYQETSLCSSFVFFYLIHFFFPPPHKLTTFLLKHWEISFPAYVSSLLLPSSTINIRSWYFSGWQISQRASTSLLLDSTSHFCSISMYTAYYVAHLKKSRRLSKRDIHSLPSHSENFATGQNCPDITILNYLDHAQGDRQFWSGTHLLLFPYKLVPWGYKLVDFQTLEIWNYSINSQKENKVSLQNNAPLDIVC